MVMFICYGDRAAYWYQDSTPDSGRNPLLIEAPFCGTLLALRNTQFRI